MMMKGTLDQKKATKLLSDDGSVQTHGGKR